MYKQLVSITAVVFSAATSLFAGHLPTTRDFLYTTSPQLHGVDSTALTYPISYEVKDTLPTANDYLYAKVNSISFFESTAGTKQCSGLERTLDLSGNQYIRFYKRIGGYASPTNIGSINVGTTAVSVAAKQLGVTLGSGAGEYNCVQIDILYKNGGKAAGSVGDKVVDTFASASSAYNPPLTLGNITMSRPGPIPSKIISAVPADNQLQIQAKGNLELENSTTYVVPAIHIVVGPTTSFTLKNIGYGPVTLSSAKIPSMLAPLMQMHGCSGVVSSGGACSFVINNGRLFETGTNGLAIGFTTSDTTNKANSFVIPFFVTKSGGAKMWGLNDQGQLGNNNKRNLTIPGDVNSLTTDVMMLTGGEDHSCALLSGGGVKCWGANNFGQLGTGNTTPSLVPVNVPRLGGVSEISAGKEFTCALIPYLGEVRCWGLGTSGQLGDGNATSSNTPVKVTGLGFIVAISAGADYACALSSKGSVKCWGNNSDGQLGNGTTTQADSPVQVSGLTLGTAAITSGKAHSCAMSNTGQVKCWGRNIEGQLGIKTNTNSLVPTPVLDLASPYQLLVSAGGQSTCVLTVKDTLKCFGDNSNGQLGNNSKINANTPQSVNTSNITINQISDVVLGKAHTCALIKNKTVKCWGDGTFGQLGNGRKATDATMPVDVLSLSAAIGILASSAAASTSGAIV